MWSYYGTKKKISKYYPKPIHDTIIEPFAGAGQYSLFGNNWKKQVILIDKYKVIVDIWKYLIRAKKEDILKLPDMFENNNIDNHNELLPEEKYLIGFCINCGSACPKKTAKKYNNWNKQKIIIANNLYKIKHWKVFYNEYINIPNKKATWFIDPPYQFGGEWYRESNKKIDYQSLGEWCKSRKGQIIVCENTKANWLDFKPLRQIQGARNTNTVEAIWSNHKTNYDAVQQSLQF